MDDLTVVNSISEEEKLEAKRTSKQYKDTLFRTLFQDKKRFIELYNAIAHENYPESAEIKPCPTNPIMAMFNDLAFLLGSKLIVMCEHQSTTNPNMPLRFLFYISDVLRTYAINKDNLYSRVLVQIPAPEFFILYNGKDELKEKKMILSDSFLMKDREFTLELTVKVINIRYGSGEDAIKRSATLSGYSFLISEVEKNISDGITRDEAIMKAMNTCIEKGILAEFLRNNFEGVIDMLTFEYDQEAAYRAMRQDGLREGMEKGMEKGKQEGRRDIIIQMIAKGKSVDEISDLIGISKNELQQLIN
ncbi:MAG: hypothetical protein FWH55_10145 [Oscillospiraceae bacterium]|nr:hypothetical protein [Oscillospiraceae bacterium]